MVSFVTWKADSRPPRTRIVVCRKISIGLHSNVGCAYLESIEVGVSLEREFFGYPLPCALVLFVQTHEEHRVDGVDDSIPNASCVG